MPATPQETEQAWQLVTALVSNGTIGPPRNSDNDAEWEKIFYRALELARLYGDTASNFP